MTPAVTGLLDGRDDGFGIGRSDHNAFDAGADHILNGGHLGGIVAVKLASGGHQFGAFGFGFIFSAFFHFHEEGIGVGFGDQADFYGAGSSGRSSGSGFFTPAFVETNFGHPRSQHHQQLYW